MLPQRKEEEPAPVSETHAVVDVGAVVVKLGHAAVADPGIIIVTHSHSLSPLTCSAWLGGV